MRTATNLRSLDAEQSERYLENLYTSSKHNGHSLRSVSPSQLQIACSCVSQCWQREAGPLPNFLVFSVPLFAVALRDNIKDPDHQEVQEFRAVLGEALGGCVTFLNEYSAHGQAARLALAVLRSDTLQAYTQILAADLTYLSATANPSHEVCPDYCGSNLQDVLLLLQSLALPVVNPASPHRRVMRRALLSALADSQVLEHAARLRLGLQDYEVRAQQAEARAESRARQPRVPLSQLEIMDMFRRSSSIASRADPAILASCDLALHLLLANWLGDVWLPAASYRLDGDTVHFAMPCMLQELGARQRSQLRSILSGPCLQALLGWQLAAPLSAEAAAAAPVWGLPAGTRLLPQASTSADPAVMDRAVQTAGAVWLGLLALDGLGERTAAAPAGRSRSGAASSKRRALAAQRVPYRVGQALSMLRAGVAHAGAEGDALKTRTLELAAGCLAAGWRRMRPAAAADCLRELWAQLLLAMRRPCGAVNGGRHDHLERCALVGGMLLMLDVPAPAGGGSGAGDRSGDSGVQTVPNDATCPSWSLRCALDAGLLRTVEGAVRREGQHTVDTQLSAAMTVEVLLRRPGVWPAVLAHGPPDQVAALVVSLRKVVAAASTRPSPEMLWHLQLRGLLEQAAAALAELDAHTESCQGLARAAVAAGRRANEGFASTELLCRRLRVNQGISGVGGGAPAAAFDISAERLGIAPVWADVARAGGCPAAGSPAAEQLRRLAVFAAAQWLPVGLTIQGPRGTVCCYSLSSLTAHQSYLVLLHWLLLAAEQCRAIAVTPVAATGDREPPSVAAFKSWRALLLAALAPSLALAQPVARHPPGSQLPLIEVAERILVAMPEVVAQMQANALAATHGPSPAAMVPLLQRHGRQDLLATLEELAGFRGAAGMPQGWVAGRLVCTVPALPGRSPLPPPCVAAEALRLCDNPECAVLAGGSEADAQLLVCGGCRAVRYCCAACQRQHWREGHKAKCRGGR